MMIAYSKLEDYMQCFKEHEAIVEAIIKRDLLAVKKAIKQNIK
jgi:DNA-binding GntR family transcriptional regulator